MRGSEAELPPGLELPRISALAYGAGHTGHALPRVAPGLRMDVGGQGPASVTDCMSTESESPSPAQREKVLVVRLTAREHVAALLLFLAVMARVQHSPRTSRPHPPLRTPSSTHHGQDLPP